MIRSILLYLLVLVGIFIFSIMYLDSLAVTLLVAMIFLPAILFLLHFIAVRFLTFSIERTPSALVEQDSASFSLKVKNQSFFPIVTCIAYVEIKNDLLGTSSMNKYRFSSSAYDISSIQETISLIQSGNYTISLTKVYAFSFLSLFRKKWNLKKSISYIRLPEIVPINLKEIRATKSSLDGVHYSKTKAGDDPSEVFALREFRDGDSLRQIHWKLSTKTGEFIVRENSLPLTSDTFLVFSVIKETEPSFHQQLEEALSLTLSASLTLIQSEISHVLYWYDTINQQYQHRKIDTTEDSYRAFYELLKTPLPMGIPSELPDELRKTSYLKVTALQTASLFLENTYEY